MNESSRWSRGLDYMGGRAFGSQEDQFLRGLFSNRHERRDGTGPMPEENSYEFTPGRYLENRFNKSGVGLGYNFLKGFMS